MYAECFICENKMQLNRKTKEKHNNSIKSITKVWGFGSDEDKSFE